MSFSLLWAMLAFFFNFVPNPGSMMAAVPADLVALFEMRVRRGAVVGAGYGVVHVVVGNIVELKLMGRYLGLSTLVVF